ncbi:hypothetical protein [Acidocella sp.]|uniref:hypothetical protein n=1 Tax=Acidocella sp. TaxID=50710 RepID=UPI002622ED85|nr:hypothetical protein [Acidocella sp.]
MTPQFDALLQDDKFLLLVFVEQTRFRHVSSLDRATFQDAYAQASQLHPALVDQFYGRALSHLTTQNILRHVANTKQPSNPNYEIDHYFIDEARELYSNPLLLEASLSTASMEAGKVAPAADRFVSLSDNQIDTTQAVAAIEKLDKAVRESNELTIDAQDRLQLSREIHVIKDILTEPRIHVVALYDAAKNSSLLKWLAEQTASVAVKLAATDTIQALGHLLQKLLSHI